MNYYIYHNNYIRGKPSICALWADSILTADIAFQTAIGSKPNKSHIGCEWFYPQQIKEKGLKYEAIYQ